MIEITNFDPEYLKQVLVKNDNILLVDPAGHIKSQVFLDVVRCPHNHGPKPACNTTCNKFALHTASNFEGHGFCLDTNVLKCIRINREPKINKVTEI